MAQVSAAARRLAGFAIVGSIALLASCGGPNGGTTGSGGTTPPDPSTVPASVAIITSSSQLNSDGKTPISLTVLVKNSSNAALSGTAVKFSATSGVVVAAAASTDGSGSISGTLNTGGDPTNRTITVNATAGSITGSATVAVNGSTLSVSGSGSIVLNSTTNLSIKVSDSSGNAVVNAPVTISSAAGNTLASGSSSATSGSLTAVTDTAGQLVVSVTGKKSGSDTVSIAAVGLTKQFSLQVSNTNLALTAPAANASVNIQSQIPVTVHWDTNGAAVVGQTITFNSTRGVLSTTALGGGTSSTLNSLTDANGNATVYLSSSTAGAAIVQATATQNGTVAAITSENVFFNAISVASVNLQASQTVLAVFKPTSSSSIAPAQSTATLSAVVRDASNNLVQGATVNFSALDSTGGSLNVASASTDASGTATAIYTAGSTTSQQNGVVITATVVAINGVSLSPPISGTTNLTVGAQSLFVRLGTNNLISTPDANTDQQAYTALVTDSAGNPVPNVTVQFKWVPLSYTKGQFAAGTTQWVPANTTICASEDTNNNGILDPGEDLNGNGKLDPGNVASITASATTSNIGIATANLSYSKLYAEWVAGTVTATIQVSGTENKSVIANSTLAGAAGDYTNLNVNPPAIIINQPATLYTVNQTTTNSTAVYPVSGPTAACTDATQPYNFKASCNITDANNWIGWQSRNATFQGKPAVLVTNTSNQSQFDTPIPNPNNYANGNNGPYIVSDTPAPCVVGNSSFGYCVTEVTNTVNYSSTSKTAIETILSSPFGFATSCTNPN